MYLLNNSKYEINYNIKKIFLSNTSLYFKLFIIEFALI